MFVIYKRMLVPEYTYEDYQTGIMVESEDMAVDVCNALNNMYYSEGRIGFSDKDDSEFVYEEENTIGENAFDGLWE